MESTPQSTSSPASPSLYISKPEPLYEYPSPAQSDSRYRSSTESPPDLGLYSCQVSGEAPGSRSHVHSSVVTNNGWPTPSIHHSNTPKALLPEYDPFAPFNPAVPSAYTHDIYAAQTAEVTTLPVSPVPSGTISQRTSFSSAPASDGYTQVGSTPSYTPRIKMEEHSDYAPVTDALILGSPQIGHSLLSSANTYPGSLETTFYQGQAWSKVEYPSQDQLPSISTLPIPIYDRRSESQERSPAGSLDPRRGPARTRVRKLTTKEDANFQCHVKGCGKLFGRSYNFKAHMETHDAGREYPFPCPMNDCNKKFVRKTDLQRHHQSVHMKQRNHRCDYCSRYFARKDTLRRHMEDGCSKRFDIETVDFRPSGYSTNDSSAAGFAPRLGEQEPKNLSYSSTSQYSTSPGMHLHQGQRSINLASEPAAYLQRQEDYMTSIGTQDHVWPS